MRRRGAVLSAARARHPRGKGDLLRDEILDAAERLLAASRGAEDVSVRAVADAVGVTAPAIYRHFADKDELITTVCQRAFGTLGAHLAERIGDEQDPLVRLRRIAEAYVDYGLAHSQQYRVLFLEAPVADTTPHSWEELAKGPGGFGLLVAECQQAIDAGLALDDAHLLALELWSNVHGIVSLRLVMPHFPWPPVAEQIDVLDQLLRAAGRADRGSRMPIRRSSTRS